MFDVGVRRGVIYSSSDGDTGCDLFSCGLRLRLDFEVFSFLAFFGRRSFEFMLVWVELLRV